MADAHSWQLAHFNWQAAASPNPISKSNLHQNSGPKTIPIKSEMKLKGTERGGQHFTPLVHNYVHLIFAYRTNKSYPRIRHVLDLDQDEELLFPLGRTHLAPWIFRKWRKSLNVYLVVYLFAKLGPAICCSVECAEFPPWSWPRPLQRTSLIGGDPLWFSLILVYLFVLHCCCLFVAVQQGKN